MGKPNCKQCDGDMKKTTMNNRSSAKQILGLFLFLAGIVVSFTGGFIIGIPMVIIGSMVFGGKTTKVWKCRDCGYFFERA